MTTQAKHRKRICLFSDGTSLRTASAAWSIRILTDHTGTWQTPENLVPTNIVRLAMGVRAEDKHGIQQISFYDPGLGTRGGLDFAVGGGLGEGIDRNIKQLYMFLALNYDEGDEVYMFGFSRGAYTVRSLAGMLNVVGLTRRAHVHYVAEAYELYRSTSNADAPKAVAFRDAHGGRINITLLACFDTVRML
eukprot:IDg8440t1